MGIVSSFINSLLLPRKKAVLNINKIKIGSSVAYFFILLMIVTLPDLIRLLLTDDLNGVPRSVYMVQLLVFYPFQSIFSGLIGITLVAAVGVILNKLVKRKLKYALLWKMSIHAATIPLLLYAIIKNLFANNIYVTTILVLSVFIILLKMITVFPKPKQK